MFKLYGNLLKAFMLIAFVCGCSSSQIDAHTLNVDITAQRVIKLASFEKSTLDRDKYFRTYHIPGSFDKQIDDDLKLIGAIPGRGTGPYYGFDKRHSFVLEGEKSNHSEQDFLALVERQNQRYSRIYNIAAERYPDVKHALSAAPTFPENMRADQAGKILKSDHYEDFAKLIVRFYDQLKKDNCSYPSWFTTLNEPIWQWGADEFAKYSRILAKVLAVKHPDIKVCGPCSAWPYPQSDWRRWDTWEKRFIEIAGKSMGAYDLHMYSKGYWAFTDERLMDDPLYMKQQSPSLYKVQRNGIGTVWDYGRMDAYLDLFIAYHSSYWNQEPKPMIISEFGRQGIEPQLGPWQNEFKPWLYMTTVVRFWMSFMERPEIELTVPFILGQADLVYGASRGQAVYNRPNAPEDTSCRVTRFRDFYAFFKDLQGKRLFSNITGSEIAISRDIVSRAFIDGKTVYILVHNGIGYPEGEQTISINPIISKSKSGKPLEVVSSRIKRMRWEGAIPADHSATDLEGKLRIDSDYKSLSSLKSIKLSGEETAIICLELSDEPVLRSFVEYLDYSKDNTVEPDKKGQCRFSLFVPQRIAEVKGAKLFVSLARDGGFSVNPDIIINGKTQSGFDVSYSKGIKNFHRAVEVPIDAKLLKQDNIIVVKFNGDEYKTGNSKAVTVKLSTIVESE